MMSTDDSLRVTENEDGTLTIEWDSNDPRYSIFNGLSEEEMNTVITKMLEDYIAELKNE